jgi:hypothetical protein
MSRRLQVVINAPACWLSAQQPCNSNSSDAIPEGYSVYVIGGLWTTTAQRERVPKPRPEGLARPCAGRWRQNWGLIYCILQ